MRIFSGVLVRCLPVALGLLISQSMAAPASASFLGDFVFCTPGFSLGSLTIEPTATISDPDVEFTLAQPGLDLFAFDFSVNTLTVTCLNGPNSISGSNPITFGDLNCGANAAEVILGLLLAPGSMVLGPGSISFTDDTVTVDLQGYWQTGDQATIVITSTCDTVPLEPNSWGHLKSGFEE